MGTRIESVATSHGHRGPLGRGALRLSDRAAKACLARAGRRAEEIDLIVNAGLYKDRSLAEPALASIIQEDVGANPGDRPRADRHGTFSFDVMNGGCGVLTAAQVVHTFVQAGAARLGLVVAADAVSAPGQGIAFPPAGGAMLLAQCEGDAGFGAFALHTFPDRAGLFEARVAWQGPGVGARGKGRNVLTIREDPAFGPECIACGAEVARAFLDAGRLRVQDVDLLVAGEYPLRFSDAVAQALGIDPERVARPPGKLAGAYTAGAIAALQGAMESGALERSHNVLFLTAGAGLTIGAALYTRTRA